jgi:hypothetical protein
MNAFFERHLLQDDALHGDIHIIFPMIFGVFMCDRKTMNNAMKVTKVNANTAKRHLYILQCCLCERNVEKQNVRTALRIVANCKKASSSSNEWKLTYRIDHASICWNCVPKPKHMVRIQAEMMLVLLSVVNESLMPLQHFTWDKRVTSRYLLETIRDFGEKCYTQFLHTLGKAVSRCIACSKEVPTDRCSGCHFFRFCSKTCAEKFWPIHKEPCHFLRSCKSIFLKEIILKG